MEGFDGDCIYKQLYLVSIFAVEQCCFSDSCVCQIKQSVKKASTCYVTPLLISIYLFITLTAVVGELLNISNLFDA